LAKKRECFGFGRALKNQRGAQKKQGKKGVVRGAIVRVSNNLSYYLS
jgi:hypothetical protein